MGSSQIVELQMGLSSHLDGAQLITSGQGAAGYLGIC